MTGRSNSDAHSAIDDPQSEASSTESIVSKTLAARPAVLSSHPVACTYPDVLPGRRNRERLDLAQDILLVQLQTVCRIKLSRPVFLDAGPRIRNVPKARGLGSVIRVNKPPRNRMPRAAAKRFSGFLSVASSSSQAPFGPLFLWVCGKKTRGRNDALNGRFKL
jgi:hypothetical protein